MTKFLNDMTDLQNNQLLISLVKFLFKETSSFFFFALGFINSHLWNNYPLQLISGTKVSCLPAGVNNTVYSQTALACVLHVSRRIKLDTCHNVTREILAVLVT